MMQMALHQIVNVITVRDCLVTASRAVGIFASWAPQAWVGVQAEGFVPPSASACSCTGLCPP
jgi:hypothetical protein